MKGRLAKKEVQQRGGVGLNDKEEEFFGGDLKECRTDYGIRRIAPNSRSDQV